MLLLACMMNVTALTGCGGADAADAFLEEEAESDAAADDGTVLNICCWDTGLRDCMEKYYPDYERLDEVTGRIDGVTVRFLITSTEDNAYEEHLDTILPGNASESADNKVDLFMVDAGNAARYTAMDVNLALPLAELGITEEELSGQYAFTRELVTDAEGNQRGASWQACASGMIYNRSLAAGILGSDDPKEVQEAVQDWESFAGTAKQVRKSGYCITSTVYDTYRAYACSASQGWTRRNGRLSVDDSLRQWAEDSKKLLDAEETGMAELWSDEWNRGFYEDTPVFAYFGPLWLINDVMHAQEEGSTAENGGWGLTKGPQSFFWGGSWLCAAVGTDNQTLAGKILRTLTTDAAVMKEIAKGEGECVNNKKVLKELASDASMGNPVLGGQNPYGILAEAAESIDLPVSSAEGQAADEAFQSAMRSYLEGEATYQEALERFQDCMAE